MNKHGKGDLPHSKNLKAARDTAACLGSISKGIISWILAGRSHQRGAFSSRSVLVQKTPLAACDSYVASSIHPKRKLFDSIPHNIERGVAEQDVIPLDSFGHCTTLVAGRDLRRRAESDEILRPV